MWYKALDMGGNIIFFLDILVMFNTSYYDYNGEEIQNRWLIAKNYMRGNLLIDFISSFPFDFLGGPYASKLKLFSVLKVIRIRRIKALINGLTLDVETKAVSHVSVTIFSPSKL
jgi:hypothetical protein